MSNEEKLSLNPLNQVYVFNEVFELQVLVRRELSCLNPLNQVYVFNVTVMSCLTQQKGLVLIP